MSWTIGWIATVLGVLGIAAALATGIRRRRSSAQRLAPVPEPPPRVTAGVAG
jgi:hypothetical protein